MSGEYMLVTLLVLSPRPWMFADDKKQMGNQLCNNASPSLFSGCVSRTIQV